MPVFDFTAEALTRREERREGCGKILTRVNVYTGRRMPWRNDCRIFQGPNACPSCRAQVIARETANLSEAGSWLYWCIYPHSTESLRWQADQKWMYRHGVRYRGCYQGNGARLLFVENRHPNIPGLQQIRIEDIDWEALMDEMPEGSSFVGNLRIPKVEAEDLPLVKCEVLFVEAARDIRAAAWEATMERTCPLDPNTIEELEAALAERIGAYKEELIRLGGKASRARIEKIRVQIALVDWSTYNAIWTQTRECDPMMVTSGYLGIV